MADYNRPNPIKIESGESISDSHSVHSDNIEEKMKDLDEVLESPFPNLFENLVDQNNSDQTQSGSKTSRGRRSSVSFAKRSRSNSI